MIVEGRFPHLPPDKPADTYKITVAALLRLAEEADAANVPLISFVLLKAAVEIAGIDPRQNPR